MVVKKYQQDTWFLRDDPKKITYSCEPVLKWKENTGAAKSCYACQSHRNPDSFPRIPKIGFGFVDPEGRPRFQVCKKCLGAVHDFFTEIDVDKNKYRALYHLCAVSGLYYQDEIAHQVLDEPLCYEDGTPVPEEVNRIEIYFRTIMDDDRYKNRSFYESENVRWEDTVKAQRNQNIFDQFSEEDKKNRLTILSTFHRDVFENEPLAERKILMADLVTMVDDGMADDFVRQQAAIEIVRTFRRINKISEALQELQKTPEATANNSKTIKELVDQKKKETDMVTAFSKDHGFAEKYALSKSKGSGTLGAIVRDMNEKGYDRGAINRFDIETAAAMKQVSDISAESIFKQIALTDSDYTQMVKEQATIIRNMREVMEKQAEELRVLREKHLKQELLEEYKKDLADKDIKEEEIEALVNEQLMRETKFDYQGGV